MNFIVTACFGRDPDPLLKTVTWPVDVYILTFFLMKVIPGDPLTQERAVPKEIMEAMRDYQQGKMGFLVEDFDWIQLTFNNKI